MNKTLRKKGVKIWLKRIRHDGQHFEEEEEERLKEG